jgi:hypothetical protein
MGGQEKGKLLLYYRMCMCNSSLVTNDNYLILFVVFLWSLALTGSFFVLNVKPCLKRTTE